MAVDFDLVTDYTDPVRTVDIGCQDTSAAFEGNSEELTINHKNLVTKCTSEVVKCKLVAE